jgi:hypothetical protein
MKELAGRQELVYRKSEKQDYIVSGEEIVK